MNPLLQQTIREAQQRLVRDDRAGARQRLAQAVRQHPREAELWYWLARALDDRAQVVDALQRALRWNPALDEARRFLDEVQGDPSWGQWARDEEPPSSSASADDAAPTPDAAPAAAWSSLDEDAVPMPAATSPLPDTPGEGWSFLEELSRDAPPAPTPRRADAPTTVEDGGEWSLLDELTLGTDAPDPRQNAATPTPDAPLSEAELWQRAEAFIGPAPASRVSVSTPVAAQTGAPTPKAPASPEPERGTFSFRDAPPSPAATVPVRNSLTPLSAEQLRAALEPAAPQGKVKARSEPKARPGPKRGRGWLAGLARLLLVALVLAGLAAGVWYILRNGLVPASVRESNPAVAAAIAAAEQRVAPRATPFPLADWVAEAEAARYANDRARAETLLRDGLTREPDNVVALAALSDLLRDQPAGQAEALALAQQAQEAAQTADERALATEASLWAMLRWPAPDEAVAQERAAQALADAPNSPHARWAQAIAAALSGDAATARAAAQRAMALSATDTTGRSAAKMAELLARLGDVDGAVGHLERALDQSDYVPWRVALVLLLRDAGRDDEAAPHRDHLQRIAPDDPAVQGLGR